MIYSRHEKQIFALRNTKKSSIYGIVSRVECHKFDSSCSIPNLREKRVEWKEISSSSISSISSGLMELTELRNISEELSARKTRVRHDLECKRAAREQLERRVEAKKRQLEEAREQAKKDCAELALHRLNQLTSCVAAKQTQIKCLKAEIEKIKVESEALNLERVEHKKKFENAILNCNEELKENLQFAKEICIDQQLESIEKMIQNLLRDKN